MIHALFLALLVTGAADKHPSHPKPPAKPAAPKPPPPPAEPDDLGDDPDPLDLPDEPDDPGDLEVHSTTKKSSSSTTTRKTNRYSSSTEYSDEQYQAIGAAGLCCCFIFVVGLIALVVWLVRRASAPATAPQQAPMTSAPPTGPPPPSIPFHLSVLAIGMHTTARQLVAQQLLLAGAQADPTTAPERTQLVRELSKAVRGLETEWTHFGYGERLDLADDDAAQRSYQLAVEDFGRRSAETSLSGESTYVVMTLVLCTRRQLRGVTALDDRAQIRTLLEDRTALGENDLMGAYIAWSSPLGGHEVLSRFPEMHAVR